MKNILLLMILLRTSIHVFAQQAYPYIFTAPAGSKYTQIHKDGETITPLGRIITPRGKQIMVAPHPYGLALSSDGSIAITANSGTSPLSISIIKKINELNPEVLQIPEGAKSDKEVLESVFMGLAISPDNQTVFVGGGQSNKIYLFDINTGKGKGFVNCSFKTDSIDYSHGYIGDLVLSKDGKFLYALDQINFRMMIVDVAKQVVVKNIPTGRYPFGICLSTDGKKAFVANVGMYAYSLIKSLDKNKLGETSLKFPAYGYLSQASETGIKNDTLEVAPLGLPNTTASFSVWTIDLDSKKVVSKVKTGFLVGHKHKDIPAVGGSSPNSVVASDKYVFVSNGSNDCISVIDIKKQTVVDTIFLTLDKRLGNIRGIIPFGLAISPDQRRLYVAEAGINAIGVIDISSRKVLGHIPTGWFPAKIQTSADGKKLIVTNAKGYGSGPNGGKSFKPGPEGTYIGALMYGSVSVMNIPSDKELTIETQKVVSNNLVITKTDDATLASKKDHPIPLFPGQKDSPIKYIVFIAKENRTYDEVFGQLKNGKGASHLARYGYKVNFTNKSKSVQVDGATVMPNHLALARRFAISDNFYVNSDHSADGHRWLVDNYPNEWMETHVSAAYGGSRSSVVESKAPGNWGMSGASGAIYPEDYNEAGSIWDHLERNKKEFFNFGFGVEFDNGSYSDSTMKYGGVRYLVNYPLPGPLYSRTSRVYPTYNMAIPDQFRADLFIKECQEKWVAPGKNLPPVFTLTLPNDHGSKERPHAGFPYRESYMSDNDLAVGRVIEYLSHTPYWKNMAIFITEDDSQDGKDHIDAHRSLLMMISPYAKKNYVGHTHTSFGSIFKTFWHILGIPYLNQYDALASDLSDLFTDIPDYTPYNAQMVDARVFDPAKALTPLHENFDWKALKESPELDKVEDFIRSKEEEDE